MFLNYKENDNLRHTMVNNTKYIKERAYLSDIKILQNLSIMSMLSKFIRFVEPVAISIAYRYVHSVV